MANTCVMKRDFWGEINTKAWKQGQSTVQSDWVKMLFSLIFLTGRWGTPIRDGSIWNHTYQVSLITVWEWLTLWVKEENNLSDSSHFEGVKAEDLATLSRSVLGANWTQKQALASFAFIDWFRLSSGCWNYSLALVGLADDIWELVNLQRDRLDIVFF